MPLRRSAIALSLVAAVGPLNRSGLTRPSLAAAAGLPPAAIASTHRVASSARQFVNGNCTARLIVAQLRVQSGCTIDQRITQAPGVLEYACGGGWARASFGASAFAGTFRGGVINLQIRTAFPFTDGCNWQTQQRIFGVLASGNLSYSYLESPMPGQTNCARPCGATGAVIATQ